MFVCCEWCVLSEFSVSGLSLVQGSPTECGVSERDRESLIMRRTSGGLSGNSKKI
jgi:hypothetical protein